ncbi:MAG: flavodoxin family protein [Pseudomonadota bacterium]
MPARPPKKPLLAIGISGSPRAGGNTDTLLAACLDGIRAAGARAETIYVRDLRVSGCLECLRCQEGEGCPQEDDAQGVLSRLATADLVIMAAPVFFSGVPAQLKTLIDRAQPLWPHRLPPDHPRRQWRASFFLTVAAGNRPEAFAGSVQTARSFLATLGTTYMGELTAGGLEPPGAAAADSDLLRRARDEGRRLVDTLAARRRELRRQWLGEEADHIGHAGEIPEVALHAAVHALTASLDGPGLSNLTPRERRLLERAVLERYSRIVLRDLTFRNRRFGIFRATSRAMVNFARLTDFARRFRFSPASLRAQAAQLLSTYLSAEIASGWHCRGIDCDRAEVEEFAARLGLDLGPFAAALPELFSRPPLHWKETQRLVFMTTTEHYPFRFCRAEDDYVEVGVATAEQEAPQRIRLPLHDNREANLAKAKAIHESIPKPDLPLRT